LERRKERITLRIHKNIVLAFYWERNIISYLKYKTGRINKPRNKTGELRFLRVVHIPQNVNIKNSSGKKKNKNPTLPL
jgi:hypothetical protein